MMSIYFYDFIDFLFFHFHLGSLFGLINMLVLLVFVLLAIAITTLLERRLMSSMQRRRGPNFVGMFGFLQPFADGLKALIKENIVPRDADSFVFFLAPLFTFFCTWKVWSFIQFSEDDYSVYVTNGLLYLLIILSFSAYGIIFAGWSSNSKYAFLGGLRSTAQMISYEVCMSFSFLAVVLLSESVDIRDIVTMQTHVWFIFPLFPFWFVFIVCGLAETNRAPFDLPEAEAELVAGYNVEYSAIPFALFFLAEYGNILAFGAMSSILFWGGWLAPLTFLSFVPGSIWLGIKLSLHVFLFVWVRATLPRYRYDQLMKLGWKILLPLSLFLLFSVSFIYLHLDKYASLYY